MQIVKMKHADFYVIYKIYVKYIIYIWYVYITKSLHLAKQYNNLQ